MRKIKEVLRLHFDSVSRSASYQSLHWDIPHHGRRLSGPCQKRRSGLAASLKKRFVEDGLPTAIERKTRETLPCEIQFGGEFEAKLLALACSDAPEGRKRWTMRLLAEKMIELKIVPSVSPMTVCNTLKK